MAIVIHLGHGAPPGVDLSVDGVTLPWSSEVKYLGVLLDRRLLWSLQAESVRAKAFAALARLWPILCPQVLSMGTKRRLYKACVLSVIEYAAPVWSGVPQSTLYRIQVVQNSALRLVLGRGRYDRVSEMGSWNP